LIIISLDLTTECLWTFHLHIHMPTTLLFSFYVRLLHGVLSNGKCFLLHVCYVSLYINCMPHSNTPSDSNNWLHLSRYRCT
jgi:hypothetical protein